MDRSQERLAAGAAALAAGGFVLDAFLARLSGLFAPRVLLPYLAVTALVSAVVWFRAWLARRAEEEAQDAELAVREQPESRLFAPAGEGAETEPFSAARGRAQFERWFVTLLAPVLALVQGALAWRLYIALTTVPAGATRARLLCAAVLAGQAFACFLPSRYLLGLGREAAHRLLRGPGILLGLVALGSLLAAGAALAVEAGAPVADRVAAFLLLGVLALLAVESVLATIAALYRPRGAEPGPATTYESRLGRLVTDPSGWVHGATEALDYQFGFKVSETWFFRFFEQALVPLLIFQLLVLYALSCFVFLGPEEEGIVERFGRPRAPDSGGWHLSSGAHFTWPWPFETVRRFPTGRIQTTHIGYDVALSSTNRTVLWTRPHYREEDKFLVATRAPEGGSTPGATVPVNLLSFNIPIEFRIDDVYRYAYDYADPVGVLRDVAYRSLTREAVARDLFEVLGAGQQALAEALRARIQDEADRLELGVRVVFVGLQGVHPPVPVADAFESVVGATEEKEAAILKARAYAGRQTAVSAADAHRDVAAAEGDRARRIAVSSAEHDAFTLRKTAADQAPAVFRSRYYLRGVLDAMKGSRPYIVVADPDREVVQFNFEERTPASLFDLSPPAKPGAGVGAAGEEAP